MGGKKRGAIVLKRRLCIASRKKKVRRDEQDRSGKGRGRKGGVFLPRPCQDVKRRGLLREKISRDGALDGPEGSPKGDFKESVGGERIREVYT